MKLPKTDAAIIPQQKITRYPLNRAHPGGGSKASSFLRFGFTVADWRGLAEVLVRHAQENDVVETEEARHGTRYVVDGSLTAPDSTVLNIRAAWYIHPGDDAPRFVTAHPPPRLIEVALDHVAYGWSAEEIHRQQPHFSLAQSHAALAFYYDHQKEFDKAIAESLSRAEKLAAESSDSPGWRKLQAGGAIP